MSEFLTEVTQELAEKPDASLTDLVSGLDKRDDIPGLVNGPQVRLRHV
jgi:hypothetical protein